MISVLHYLGDVAIWTSLVSSYAFCFSYALVAPWRKTEEGWHLMTFTFVIGVAFSWIAYRLVTANHRVGLPMKTEASRTAIYVALAGVLVWRLALLVRTQIRRKQDDYENRS
jgi:ribosomal protein L15E